MEVNVVSQGRQKAEIFNSDKTTAKVIASCEKAENNVKSSNKRVSETDIKRALDKFNKLLEDKSTHLKYEVYGKFKDIVVKVIDDNTEDVIKELPPKSIIDMVDKFCEMAGMFVDKKV
ncbi:flagellar protein [Clostridium fermenticellae]|uniref:Flagellar protein n=1 Tax=Clostridium fermenticellae TaxID=2068654 RepID=A0A386H523_9CLOT|nr:flagellar protein FlaG [Clostridium fermenticellae]AYD40714.1 flagellar protein [Clostridium fermenticellae]